MNDEERQPRPDMIPQEHLRSLIETKIVEAIQCADKLDNAQFVRHLLMMALLTVENNTTTSSSDLENDNALALTAARHRRTL